MSNQFAVGYFSNTYLLVLHELAANERTLGKVAFLLKVCEFFLIGYEFIYQFRKFLHSRI